MRLLGGPRHSPGMGLSLACFGSLDYKDSLVSKGPMRADLRRIESTPIDVVTLVALCYLYIGKVEHCRDENACGLIDDVIRFTLETHDVGTVTQCRADQVDRARYWQIKG